MPTKEELSAIRRRAILTESCFDAQDSVAVFEISFYVRHARKA